MYCPIDKAKAIWLCLTLLVLFILVLCIVLPITLTHQRTDTCAVEGCLFDNECLDRCIRETQTENNHIYSLTTESTDHPTTPVSTTDPPVSTTDSSTTNTYPTDPPVSTTDSSTYPTDPPVTDPPVTCSPTACNKACTLGC